MRLKLLLFLSLLFVPGLFGQSIIIYSSGSLIVYPGGTVGVYPTPVLTTTPIVSTPVFACSLNFVADTSGVCGVGSWQHSPQAFAIVGSTGNSPGSAGSPSITSGALNFAPTGAIHNGMSLIYQSKVNVQAFTSSFSFIMNGQYLAWFLENNTNSNGGAASMAGGAGGEDDVFQGNTNGGQYPNPSPNNIVSIIFNAYDPATNAGVFGCSSIVLTQAAQAPLLPVTTIAGYIPEYATNKTCTTPVTFNSPATTANTTNGHLINAVVTYDGATLTLGLTDTVTSQTFTRSWPGINIPSLVNGNTAYVGLGNGTGSASLFPLTVDSFTYATSTAPATPTVSTYTTLEGAPFAAAPTFSLAAGTYTGAQALALTSTTSGAYICYFASATPPSIYPTPDNIGGCVNSSLYTGPITVSSSETVYAIVGTPYLGLPSKLVLQAYTIH